MPLISLREASREALVAAETKILSEFRCAVRPLYRDKNLRPDHAGTATFIEFNGHDYLLTAAHVLDGHENHTLFVGQRALEPITLRFSSTVAPKGNRLKDRWDFAFAEVGPEWRTRGIKPIPVKGILRDDAQFYTAVGFPHSRNRKYNPVKRTVRPTIRTFTSNILHGESRLFSDLGIDPATHVAIARDPKWSLMDGKRVRSFEPRGMSGGPFFALYRIYKADVVAGGQEPFLDLAGIITEKSEEHHALFGTKMSAITSALT